MFFNKISWLFTRRLNSLTSPDFSENDPVNKRVDSSGGSILCRFQTIHPVWYKIRNNWIETKKKSTEQVVHKKQWNRDQRSVLIKNPPKNYLWGSRQKYVDSLQPSVLKGPSKIRLYFMNILIAESSPVTQLRIGSREEQLDSTCFLSLCPVIIPISLESSQRTGKS